MESALIRGKSLIALRNGQEIEIARSRQLFNDKWVWFSKVPGRKGGRTEHETSTQALLSAAKNFGYAVGYSTRGAS